MNYNIALFREALANDSCFVMRQAFVTLYRGGSLRPDVYFRQNATLQQKYVLTFTNEQRQTIESSASNPYAYDVETGADFYDLPILWRLVEHACGLPPSDVILTKVLEIKSLGNSVLSRHRDGDDPITRGELCQKLDELLELYVTILERVEFHATRYLSFEKTEIERRILEKKARSQSAPSVDTLHASSLFDSRPAQESWGPPPKTPPSSSSSGAYAVPLNSRTASAKKSVPLIPNIGKAALGVTTSVGKAAFDVTSSVGKAAFDVTTTVGKVAFGVTNTSARIAVRGAGAVADVVTQEVTPSGPNKNEKTDEDCVLM
ncbi:uncharacterized protein LOC135199330 [Macrobrachium nipponense]|uniref:uncharacterized protein LOC135199330 n=1 Tax=Macrobrachium nipponense TaxID=159736 RepID=UPI0030C83D88